MSIEDKYLDEGLFSGVKNIINDVKDFCDDAVKYQPQFDAMNTVGKNKTEEEIDMMVQLCSEIKRQSKSKYMRSLLDKFVTELEKQQKKLKQ